MFELSRSFSCDRVRCPNYLIIDIIAIDVISVVLVVIVDLHPSIHLSIRPSNNMHALRCQAMTESALLLSCTGWNECGRGGGTKTRFE